MAKGKTEVDRKKRVNVRVRDDLHTGLKIMCAREDKKMQEIVEEMIELRLSERGTDRTQIAS